MALKNRIIERLNSLKSNVASVEKKEDSSSSEDISNELSAVKNILKEGLSSQHFDVYDKIYREIPKVKSLQKMIDRLIKKVSQEKHFKKVFFFLPYKAAMWDSLESVYLAAAEDKEHTLAYVMPIPYCNRKPDGSSEEWHIEGDLFPENIPILNWEDVDLNEWQPDAIFVHNPYDGMNKISSVAPNYYSDKLKEVTNCLVYIPYYATVGGMGAEGFVPLPIYENANYIAIQSERHRKFFHPAIPDQKFLPFGSPKFDRVISVSKNPPEPPSEWKAKLQNKKVYFYNTTLGTLMAQPARFMRKLQYCLDIFRERKDVCLIWRPHPLLESTLISMGPEYIPIFEKIRDEFIKDDYGIYDTTPDIEKTIALSDVYIGEGASSVPALYNVAGKPAFYLNNLIYELPREDDWQGNINKIWFYQAKNWLIAYGNTLWHREEETAPFHYVCKLTEYESGGFYFKLLELDGKLYVCPNNAQDILVIENEKITRKISLERAIEKAGAFVDAMYVEGEDYFFLLPFNYPAVVCYDFRNDKLYYIPCPNDIFVNTAGGGIKRGAVFNWRDWLIFASPKDNRAFAVHRHTLETNMQPICHQNFKGAMFAIKRPSSEDEYFFFPCVGKKATRWNLAKGEAEDYDFPKGFICKNPITGALTEDNPFMNGVFTDENTIVLAPFWGNMFVKFHVDTGVMEEWKTPFEVTPYGKTDYYIAGYTGMFIEETVKMGLSKHCQFFYAPTRTRYDFDFATEEFTIAKNDAIIDENEMRDHISGFGKISDQNVYGCEENAFNSLKDLLDDNISGEKFDPKKQFEAYSEVAANLDGSAGKKIYKFILNKVSKDKK